MVPRLGRRAPLLHELAPGEVGQAGRGRQQFLRAAWDGRSC
jgi:hypothetical protein